MKKFLTPVILAGLLSVVSYGSLSAETLDEAVSYAMKNHPSVKAAAAGRAAAFETVREQKSGYFPDVSLGASAGRIYANNTTTRGLTVTRGAGYSWYGEGTANVSQTLYDWSQTSNRVNAAKSRHLSANATVEEREEAIAYQVAQAYIQILRAQTLRDKAQENLDSAKNYIARIRSLVSDGGADESELSRAKDIVSLGENTLLQFETDYEMALAAYIEAVGRMPEGDLTEPKFHIGKIPGDIDSALDFALQNNPQIKAAAYEARAAGYDIKTEKANILPRLDAEMSYLKRDQDDVIGGESEDGRALVRMTWDYSVGGAQLAAQRRTVDLAEEARMNKDALERVIMRDVRVSWASLDMARRQKEIETKRLKSAQDTLSTYNEQYEGAQKSVLELMQADMQVFNADIAYQNVYYSELDAAFALATTLGLLESVVKTEIPKPIAVKPLQEVVVAEEVIAVEGDPVTSETVPQPDVYVLELRESGGEELSLPPYPSRKPESVEG